MAPASVKSRNLSARIDEVEDGRSATYWTSTFKFTYTAEALPHLSGMTNTVGTGERYTLG